MPLATHHVFVSATSGDLGSYRRAARDALLTRGLHPEVQDHFGLDHRTIEAMIRDKVSQCDAVICLVGSVYGFEPSARDPAAPRRSYTQMEYDFGRAFGKPVYVLLAADDCPPDATVDEPDDVRQLQRDHRAWLRKQDTVWYTFRSADEVQRWIRSLDLPGAGRPSTTKPRNLPFDSLGPLFKGRDAFVERLRETLRRRPGAAAAVVAKQAIHGLGGVGKTRLAVEYAHRFAADYTALLCAVADSPENLRRNLASLCGAGVLNLPERDAKEEAVQVAAVVRWLETHPAWLLILDNADTPAAAKAVEDFSRG